jgi:hypothetical protein
MKLLDYVTVFFVVLAALFIGAGCEYHSLKPKIIAYDGAHYDMHTGEFVWGAAPLLANETEINGGFTEATKPLGDKHGH